MRILGIEFGAWSLKAVEMESRFRRVDILDLHEIRLPIKQLDPTASYKKAVEQLMARLPSHPEKIVTSLPPAQTALRFLQIPVKQRKKVEQMFRFELEDSIPFKLEDSIIEHYVTRTKEGSLVFAAIAPKKHIQTHLDWLKSVGVDPDWLTFEGMGVINLYLSAHIAAPPEKQTGPVLLMDIGHSKTNIAILDQDRLEFFRSIPWGGFSVSQSIAVTLNIPIEEAEQQKSTLLRLDVDELTAPEEEVDLFTAANQSFASFVADISHSLVAYRASFKKEISSIILTGGTSKIKGIDAFLTKNVGVPVDFFRPLRDLNIREELQGEAELRFGESLGRAMVFARKAALLFNFRKQELAKGTSLTEVGTFLKNPNTITLLKYAAGLALVLFFHVMIATPLAQRESRAAQEELKKVFSDTFKSVPSKLKNSLTGDPKELKKFIEQKNHELDQKLKMLAKTRVPMVGLVKGVSESFPTDLKVDVNTLTIDDRNFMLEGVLYQGDLNRVTESLKKIPSFNNIDLQQEGQRFTYKGQVVGR